MPIEWGKLLAQHGPKLALGLIASYQAGPEGAAAFMRGVQDREREEAQGRRQAQLDTRANEMHAAQMKNLTDDNTRAEASQKFERFREVAALMDRFRPQAAEIPDAVEAENAMMQRAAAAATAAGQPPDQFTGFVPSMAPVIAKGARADAAELLEKAAAQAKLRGQPYNDQTISLQWEHLSPRLKAALVSLGHVEGHAVKPSQLERLHGFTVAPGPPQTRPRSDFDEFYETEFLPAEIERRTQADNNRPLTAADKAKLRLQAREAWNRSGAAGTTAGRPSAGSGPSRSERQRTLRRRLQEAVRKGQMTAPVLNAMQAAGLDSDLELSEAQRLIDREIQTAYDRLLRQEGLVGRNVGAENKRDLMAEARRLVAGGSTPTSAPAVSPAPAGTPPGVRVGKRVRLADGRTVTVTAINPDGTFEYK